MLNQVRRIVTGLNTAGKSIVTYDGPPASVVGVNDAGLAKCWSADGGPLDKGGIRIGFLVGRPKLEFVDTGTALREIRKCRRLQGKRGVQHL